MRSLSENQFHLLMGFLVAGSLFLDRAARDLLPTWSSPSIGLVTFALGLIWVGMFAAHRLRGAKDRFTVIEDRLDRLQRRVDALEDEERRRNAHPLK